MTNTDRLAAIRGRLERDELVDEQLAGFTCAYCGGRDGKMIPLTAIAGPQLFMHVDCDNVGAAFEEAG